MTPESLGLLSGVAMPWTRWVGPHRGGRVGTTDPQLCQSLILRVVFLRESCGGPPERRQRSGVYRVTPWGAGSSDHPRPIPPGQLHRHRHGGWAALVHADDVSYLSAGLRLPGWRVGAAYHHRPSLRRLLGWLSLSLLGSFGRTSCHWLLHCAGFLFWFLLFLLLPLGDLHLGWRLHHLHLDLLLPHLLEIVPFLLKALGP